MTFFYLSELSFPLTIPENSDNTPLAKEYIIQDSLAFQPASETETPETRIVEPAANLEGSSPKTNNFDLPTELDTLSVSLLPDNSAGTISGKITDEDGWPIPFLNGSLADLTFDNTAEPLIFFSTDINGIFSIPSISPGEYNLQLFYYEIMDYQLVVPMQTSNPREIHISLDDINII